MTTILILAIPVAAAFGFILGGMVRGGTVDDAWLAGHAAGIRDERSGRLAQALWDADNLPYGGSE